MEPFYHQKQIAGLNVLEVPGEPSAPSIILFHGFGADANDLLPLSQVYRQRPRPTWLFPNGPLEIPIGQHMMGRSWFDINLALIQRCVQTNAVDALSDAFPQDLNGIRQKVLNLIAELHIPLSNLFLGGFSQGAMLATDVALHLQQNVKGLIVLSGMVVNSMQWLELAPNHAGMHFFQSHGTYDPILPFAKAKELEALLLKAKLQGTLHEFAGGHDIRQSILLKLQHFLKMRIEGL